MPFIHRPGADKTARAEAGCRAVAARNRHRMERVAEGMAALEAELAALEKAITNHRRRNT